MIHAGDLHGSHDALLVGLSFLIAVLASYTALDLARRIRDAARRGRGLRLIGAAMVLGAAIAGMPDAGLGAAAFTPAGASGPMPVRDMASYDLAVAIAAVSIAILGLGLAAAFIYRRFVHRQHGETAVLRASEQQFRTLVKNIPGLCYRCRLDADYTIEFVSDAVEALTGYPSSDFVGNRIRTLVSTYHPEDLPLVHEAGERSVATGQPFTADFRIVHRDGTVRWVHETGRAVRDENGQPAFLDGVIFDVTEQRRMESELRASEQKFKTLLNNIPGAFYRSIVDEPYTMEYVSDAIEGITGYPASDFTGSHVRNFSSLAHPEDAAMVQQALANALRKHQTFSVEYRILHEDGAYRWIHERGQGVYDEEGKLRYLDGAVFDITESHKIRDELLASEQKFKTLLGNIPGVFYRCANDADYTMEFISAAIGEVSGYPADDFIGSKVRSYASLIHPDDLGLVNDAVNAGLERREPFTIEYRIVHRDGTVHWMHEKGAGIYDINGKLLHLDGAIFDVTERRHIEEKLRETNDSLHRAMDKLAQTEKLATIGQVAATVSHELRNPLGAIRNSMALVRQLTGDKNLGVERALDRVDRNIERCTDIISDLLEFTRRKELDRQPTAIDAWLAEALAEHPLPDGIVLERDLRSSDVVGIDREKFLQAVANLVENAAQALKDPAWQPPEGHRGSILVRTETAGPHVRLSITDNGPGIPADVIERIFEPLFTTKSFGVGLGLPTVRQIVEQHGGTIDVESRINEGTTFVVWLPRQGATMQQPGNMTGHEAAA